jgi:hypothetical protein
VAQTRHDKPAPKLSYVRLFKPWNWVIDRSIFKQKSNGSAKQQIGNLRFGPDGKDYFLSLIPPAPWSCTR